MSEIVSDVCVVTVKPDVYEWLTGIATGWAEEGARAPDGPVGPGEEPVAERVGKGLAAATAAEPGRFVTPRKPPAPSRVTRLTCSECGEPLRTGRLGGLCGFCRMGIPPDPPNAARRIED